MLLASIISIYIIVGLIHGYQHMTSIYSVLTKVGRDEQYLREMVAMYEFTPQGAEYYTKLQDLHVVKAELLAEYELLKENEDKYHFQTFLLGFTLWPYYIFSIIRRKTTMKREMGR